MLWTSLSRLLSLCRIGFGMLWVHFHLFPGTFLFPSFYFVCALFVVLVFVVRVLGHLFEMFLSLLGRPVLPLTSLSGLPSLCAIDLEALCVHFHLFPETFWFILWSHWWPNHCFIAFYSVSMNLNVFELFPWGLFAVSSHCDLRKCLIWFQFSWICWGLFCVSPYGLSLKMFHVHLKRMRILFLWDERLS